MKRFKKFTEAKDAYCSDKCCGSDVKAEDCKCPPDCAHCNCNAVSENLEEFTNWSVRHPTKPTKSYKVKARNTGEALKKAHKAAVKAGDLHKQAPSDSMLYKHVKKEDVSEEQINDITAQYINENNITMSELEAMSSEQLDEIIGKAVGGAFKLGAKTAVGAGRLAKKAGSAIAKRTTSAGKLAREKEKLAKEKQKLNKARDSRSMLSKQGRANRASDAEKRQKEREKLKAQREKVKAQRERLRNARKSNDFKQK